MTRFCAECGQSTVRQNESLFVCEAGHENWLNPAVGATVFIVDDSKVLYGIRSREPGKGLLDVPGGFIEVNETAEHAAVREAKEELGVDVELVAFLGTYTRSTKIGRF